MQPVDLRRDRFVKVWRVTGNGLEATAAVVQRGRGFRAAAECVFSDGRRRSITWHSRCTARPGDDPALLTGREAVLCINQIDRTFRALPGTHVRIDFPAGSTREDQMIILMEYGLTSLVEHGSEAQPGTLEDDPLGLDCDAPSAAAD